MLGRSHRVRPEPQPAARVALCQRRGAVASRVHSRPAGGPYECRARNSKRFINREKFEIHGMSGAIPHLDVDFCMCHLTSLLTLFCESGHDFKLAPGIRSHVIFICRSVSVECSNRFGISVRSQRSVLIDLHCSRYPACWTLSVSIRSKDRTNYPPKAG